MAGVLPRYIQNYKKHSPEIFIITKNALSLHRKIQKRVFLKISKVESELFIVKKCGHEKIFEKSKKG